MGIEPQVKAGGMKPHNEPVRVRTALKAGGRYLNHNETVVREACCDLDTPQAKTISRPEERLEVLVMRAVPTADSLARP